MPDVQMALAVAVYNLLMAAVTWKAISAVRRRCTTVVWLGTCLLEGVAAGILAVLVAVPLAPTGFAVFHLAAYGVFLHGGALLVGSAIVLWSSRPVAATASALMALAGMVVAVDALLIEPLWLEVSHIRIFSDKVGRPVRIVVLADLQTDRLGKYERQVLRRTLEQDPDLVLLAGDYLQVRPARYDQLRVELNRYLREIRFSAPLGVFAVRGNIDPAGWERIFSDLPVTAVQRNQSFDVGPIRLTCLHERRSFYHALEIPNDEPHRYHVVLGHSPNFALGQIEADLLVAGHTHGGQVRLPWIGPLMNPSLLPRSQAAGLSKLPGGANLIVSRGVGMERFHAPRLRFLCRPELVVIDVIPP